MRRRFCKLGQFEMRRLGLRYNIDEFVRPSNNELEVGSVGLDLCARMDPIRIRLVERKARDLY